MWNVVVEYRVENALHVSQDDRLARLADEANKISLINGLDLSLLIGPALLPAFYIYLSVQTICRYEDRQASTETLHSC
jgi:hypothetical protein